MRSPFCRISRSFTLIEVTLGLAILVLIFGVIFQLVQMSVLGADAAARNSLRNKEISGLFAMMRQFCLDLPPSAQLRTEPRPGGGYDLLISRAPGVLLPGAGTTNRQIALTLAKDPVGGGQTLFLEEIIAPRVSAAAAFSGTPGEPSLTNRFELMRDLVGLSWKMGDPRYPYPEEATEWNDPVKPAYLRMTLVRREGSKKFTNTGVFWIPAGYGPNGQPPVDPVTRTPLALTNTNPPPA